MKQSNLKQQKKRWQEELSDEEVNPDVFKKLAVLAVEEEPEKQVVRDSNPEPQRQKEFAWMSDDDEPLPSQKQAAPEAALPEPVHKQDRDKQPEEEDLFITGIPIKAKEDDLRAYLSKFGTIEQVYMPLNDGTDIHKGKAFVRMTIREEEFIVKQHKLKGQTINIKVGSGRVNQEESPVRSRSRSRSR